MAERVYQVDGFLTTDAERCQATLLLLFNLYRDVVSAEQEMLTLFSAFPVDLKGLTRK